MKPAFRFSQISWAIDFSAAVFTVPVDTKSQKHFAICFVDDSHNLYRIQKRREQFSGIRKVPEIDHRSYAVLSRGLKKFQLRTWKNSLDGSSLFTNRRAGRRGSQRKYPCEMNDLKEKHYSKPRSEALLTWKKI